MKISPTTVNTIIVGGGHAGVNLACMLELQNKGTQYLILERAPNLLNKWRDHRWQHFQFNTPLKFSRLHGQQKEEKEQMRDDDWLLDRPLEEDLKGWDAHIEKLKILDRTRLKSNVVSVTPLSNGDFETIVGDDNDDDPNNSATTATGMMVYHSKNVVACNGVYDHNIVPTHLAQTLPSFIKQHTTAGFQLDDLVPGNVLIVGSSQSGIQLAQIMLENCRDRQLYLACSAAGGCPRNFRGRDLFYWLHRIKFLYITKESLAEMPPAKAEALRYGGGGSPVTGPNRAISPFSLERQGVILTGRLKEASNGQLYFNSDRPESLKKAKSGHDTIVGMIREFATTLEADGEHFPTEEPEAEWEVSNESLLTDPGITSIDAEQSGITNVMWACGWTSNLKWLSVDQTKANSEFDARTGLPYQIVSENYPGLFFAGYPWVGTIQSMNILNMDRDAQVITDHLRQ